MFAPSKTGEATAIFFLRRFSLVRSKRKQYLAARDKLKPSRARNVQVYIYIYIEREIARERERERERETERQKNHQGERDFRDKKVGFRSKE